MSTFTAAIPDAPALRAPSPTTRPIGWSLSVWWLVLVVVVASPLLFCARLSAAVARRRFIREARLRAALHRLGLNPAAHPIEARLLPGGLANVVALVTLRPVGAPVRRLVLKQPLFIGSLLAWGGAHLGPMPHVGPSGGAARQRRERAGLLRLEREGIPAPRCLAWDPGAGLLAMEWIDGTAFSELGATSRGVALAEAYGRTLAAVHEARVALGDGHPGNALVDGRGRLVLVDLEHATGGDAATADRMAFDLVYAESFLTRPESRAALRRGYGGVPSAVSAHLARQEQRLMAFALFVGRLPRAAGG
jgi:hypothetical protein